MSLKTWMKEFYKTPADSKEALENPLEHSIRKWTGLLKKNLDKHHLYYTEGRIYQDAETYMGITGWTSCACCRESVPGDFNYFSCFKCIITQTIGYNCFGAYSETNRDDTRKNFKPIAMVRFLKRVLKMYQKKQKSEARERKLTQKV